MPKKKKEIPDLKTEEEERAFWAGHDSAEYVDWAAAEPILMPKLKPTTRTISLRLSGSTLEKLKLIANKRDVPYQSLIKIFLTERIEKELKI